VYKQSRHREPRSGVAIQCKVDWIASWAPPPRNDASVRVNKQSRHREPRSRVAIQCKVHWIASSAAASSQ
jgi:hypothetical protein